MHDRWRIAAIFVFAVALALWGSSLALAHHKPDHSGGPPADSSGGTSEHPTEDTDSDGVPNDAGSPG